MKVLVTGAGGYIGSITTDLLLEKNFEVVALDNFSRGYKKPLEILQNKFGKKKFIWEKIDLVSDNLDLFFQKHEVDAILHFAAFCNLGESWKDPVKYFSNNVIGLQRLAASAIENGIKKIVFSSTCAVYGDAQYLPIDENHPLGVPASPYGASKKICEEILSWYSKMNLLKFVFLRYFNVTGASDDGQAGDSKNPSFHLIQNALRGALGIDKFELNYAPVNTPDGSPIRDYVNVVDLAKAHILALNYLTDQKMGSNIFNLGTGQGNSVLEIIKIVKEKTGINFPVTMSTNRRKGEADRMIADISKAKKVLGWQPQVSLKDGLIKTLEYFKRELL